MKKTNAKSRCGMAAALAGCVCAAMMSLPAFAADEFAPQRAEFAKYYRHITGKEAPEGIVRFAIDPKISKSGRDAYMIKSGATVSGATVSSATVSRATVSSATVSGWRASQPANSGRASSPAPVTITGSNTRSVWYGLYDLLERRGGCHWFWDGDVVPKRERNICDFLNEHGLLKRKLCYNKAFSLPGDYLG